MALDLALATSKPRWLTDNALDCRMAQQFLLSLLLSRLMSTIASFYFSLFFRCFRRFQLRNVYLFCSWFSTIFFVVEKTKFSAKEGKWFASTQQKRMIMVILRRLSFCIVFIRVGSYSFATPEKKEHLSTVISNYDNKISRSLVLSSPLIHNPPKVKWVLHKTTHYTNKS